MNCPVCNQNSLEVFFKTDNAPVLPNVLYDTREAALAAPRGPIHLAHCSNCSHLYNVAFDPDKLDYTQTYENSLYFSKHFRDYAEQQTQALITRYGLNKKTIVEVGCGQGDFLTGLCAGGDNRGLGFDPSYDPSKTQTAIDSRVTITPEYFSEQHADCKPDLIVCRQVLEHIPLPVAFIQSIRKTITPDADTAVFFEVPDGLYTLRDLGIWDIIYEHCSYFTPKSLTTAFENGGFDVQSVAETFGCQFLTIDAVAADGAQVKNLASVPEVDTAKLARDFAAAYQDRVAFWQRTLDDLARNDKQAVIWGAGSKGITFLNVLAEYAGVIEYAVDLNPRKHGKFVTGAGQGVVSPEFLADYQPDLVIVMNPQYHDEIQAELKQLAPEAEVLPV